MSEQGQRFLEEIHRTVTYFAREYSLSYIEMCGALKMMADQISEEGRKGNLNEKGA